MIQSLSEKYKKHIAWPLLVIFQLQILSPLSVKGRSYHDVGSYRMPVLLMKPFVKPAYKSFNEKYTPNEPVSFNNPVIENATVVLSPKAVNIGGPGSPEAASFKAVGSNNLVNLATGDFSYSIPLLDVGGYPVNLFYSGGINMEQEASWVGLGWNINPGTVSRNMRGVPDDFNGSDLLTQTQNVKPNRTWGGDLAFDIEYVGIKAPKIGIGGSLGFSYNNYLGPALEIGSRVSLSISTTKSVESEKSAPVSLGVTVGLGTKLNSRSGLTFSPSLNASLGPTDTKIGTGVGLSTSYNSRTGIKELTVTSQTKFLPMGDIIGDNLRGSKTISFAKPSYLPSLRIPMENSYSSGQLELGVGFFGFRGSITGLGYTSESKVPDELKIVKKPMVGYIYSEKATDNTNAVMDFNRLNDAEVTPNTPIISAPQFNYDVFSIQGEGTGGSIRAYRGDMGFVRDNVTSSKEKNKSIGVDLGIPFHLGYNWNSISTPTRVGGWEDGNNTLHQTMNFRPKQNNTSFENVYFKNPGESSVTSEETLNRIGRDNLVRFALGGSNAIPRLESSLEQFDKKTGTKNSDNLPVANNSLQKREKRTQVTTMLTATEAAQIGLEKIIRNYQTGSSEFDINNNIVYDSLNRVDVGTNPIRKAHHISEINVLEQSGMRYVYGIPVYSVKQKDFTFSVEGTADSSSIVNYASDEPTIDSRNMTDKSKIDGYLQIQETPGYASSFLLTGLLSPDYVDVSGNGVTEDDLGGAVKFNYTKSAELHKWRTPRQNATAATAYFNEGTRTEKKDNKAVISYGERESWYLNSVESKSMVAIFKTDSRNDAKGVISEMDGRINTSENANKKLTRIDLYTKSEIRTKGFTNAKPIKSVHFEYGYSLCTGTPDNNNSQGKLTLKSVYFSYNGQTRLVKDRYVFNYGDTTSQADNPNYSLNAADRWGTYKPKRDPISSNNNNPGALNNIDFPYTGTDKSNNDKYAGAWSLKKILLPSGGQIEVQYEADDYAYVQNRRACNMFKIFGFGNTMNYSNNPSLYNAGISSQDNYYVYIKLPKALQSSTSNDLKEEINSKYLDGINQTGGKKQLAFKLMVNMPKGAEPLTVYAEYDDYGLCANSTNKDYIYVHLKQVDGKSPLVKSTIGFLTENIPGQAFPGYEVEVDGIAAFIDMAGGMLNGLKTAFKNVDAQMRGVSKAKIVFLDSSFIRLANPEKIKYGGGLRVKKIILKDNWNKMSNQYNAVYGQDYEYTTIEKINNKDSVISSGVASYEPGIGSEENPFREILAFSNKLPLASAAYGAIEMPMLEGLYPSPSVVYSKVTVRSIHRKGKYGDSTLRSAIGKQITEYYTARDFPSYSTYTPMNIMDYNKNPFFSFFYKEIINRRTISQGFLVETNDMHGRIKSQMAYSQSDEKTPLSASFHTYKNTGKNGLNDKVDFVYNNEGGAIHPGNMGVDMELMTDVREFSVKSNGFNGQIQIDLFTFGPITIPLPTFFPLKTYVENKYRAVTCTKLINYHAIEDSVIVMDKGSVISTKTIAYDAETGSPIVTKTANEFRDPIYNVSYPAYWAYSGVGLAYKNIDRQFSNVDFHDGKIQGIAINQNEAFESGDEIFITRQGLGSPGCIAASGSTFKLWAIDKNKFSGSGIKDFIFIDSIGRPFTKSGVSFRIIRSGKRNNLGLTVFSASSLVSPIASGPDTLRVNSNTKVVASSAVEYKEKWQTDNEVFLRKVFYKDTCSDIELDSLSCSGILEKNLNPYLKGLIGNFKPNRSYTYYGSREGGDTIVTSAIRKNGFISNFSAYWNFNNSTSLLQPDPSNQKWVWNSELTKVNTKGQELETKDALNRYIAAQYGFNKNLPVAMVQNSRYGQSFYEGFEDYGYEESINKSVYNDCTEKYTDFTELTNGSIVNASYYGISAHTGVSVLRIDSGSQVTKAIKISNNNIDTYDLNFPRGKTISPFATPVSSYSGPINPIPPVIANPANISLNFSNLGLQYYATKNGNPLLAYDSATNISRFFRYYYTTQNIKIPTSGTYTFTLTASQSYDPTFDGTPDFNRAAISMVIKTLDSQSVFSRILYSDNANSVSGSVYLPCGSYIINCNVSSDIRYVGDKTDMHIFGSSVQYTSNRTATGYVISCSYDKPIPATDSMLNPVFGLVPGKKMQFSAWVKEDCTIPCYKTDFDQSNIEIRSNGTSIGNLKRTGTMIEGWQKIEGTFTLPPDSTTADLVFINTNNSPMYVDDLRIHPYNANMKSYAYDSRTLRLSAELDENNYASFYEYDEEGQLVRIKKETIQGIKTIKETRSAKQKSITDLQ